MFMTLLAATLMVCGEPDSTVRLDDVVVTEMANDPRLAGASQARRQVGHDYLTTHFSGSLMQTLDGIAGVKASAIGSGQARPVIRGLGFNRVLVSEDGVKHEGQQWGEDHGLEIDQFAVDRAEIVKGPAALTYGSDAIGGVLSLYTNHVPVAPLEGAVQLFGRTSNAQLGLSAKAGGRRGRFFWRAGLTSLDYGDYRVPADSIQYFSRWIRLDHQHLRNTAGCERDANLMVGYAGYNFHTDLRVSDSYAKSGFFADAHGLEIRSSQIDYDRSRRDVDLPYAWVNHLKILSHTAWHRDAASVEVNLAYQNNRREEHTEPLAHGYMPTPQGTLERRFDKDTWTAALRLGYEVSPHQRLEAGLGGEWQHNRRGGWGFIIPDFETAGVGGYVLDRYDVTDRLTLNAGVRYDFSRTRIHAYRDWYPIPTTGGDSVFLERASGARKDFRSLTWSAGVNWRPGRWSLRANAGKSFRVPIPKELGADGVDYHIFRYEQGNLGLDPEESYQLDLGIGWASRQVRLQIDPYVNYFPNYIYLNPTADYVENLQLYRYTQAEVFRWGVEAELSWQLSRQWQADVQGAYVYARQRSGQKKGYTLPFSVPWSADADVRYAFDWHGPNFVQVDLRVVGRQDQIVPPERPTDGYWTLGLSGEKKMDVGQTQLRVVLRADNLLDRKYFDHTSYYRLIEVPEPGRNFSLLVGWEF